MVGKLFTIIGAVLVTLATPAMAQSDGVSAHATACATILRAVLLQTSGQIMRLKTEFATVEVIPSKRDIRACATGQTLPCKIIVFDLP